MIYLDTYINLTGMIPDDLDRGSIRIFKMESMTTTELTDFSIPSLGEVLPATDQIHIYDDDYTNGLYMIAGELTPANVSVSNLTTVQQPGGALRLEWDPEGDLDNPYFGGWRIYRRLSFPFFWPYENASQFNSVIGTEVADLSPQTGSWDDPSSLPDGTCVSYLVMAIDLQGDPDYSHGSAAGWDGDSVQWQCGDATPPHIRVANMWHEVTFDNTSGENIH
ncbi:MAG: hypothetical protein H8D82_01835, partial [Euryarchaeota archaeon]|nr:hypothetical protein [Euryarchaeota archaeon]